MYKNEFLYLSKLTEIISEVINLILKYLYCYKLLKEDKKNKYKKIIPIRPFKCQHNNIKHKQIYAFINQMMPKHLISAFTLLSKTEAKHAGNYTSAATDSV